MIGAVGLEAFGLWSVLLSGASVARLADVSGGSGLARFIAEPGRSDDAHAARAVAFIHTTLIATFGLMLAGSALVLLIAPPIIRSVTPDNAEALIGLLPVALLVSILLPPMSAALSAAIDGTLRTHLRAVIMSVSHLILLSSAYFLVGTYGIYGFAAALGLQHLFLILSAWLVLRRVIPGMGWFPWHWSQPVFRESFAFGLKIQASTFAALLSDPLARFLVAGFGGAAAAGIYELSLRWIQQFRGLFVAGMQPLMPKVASLGRFPAELEALLARALRAAVWAGMAFTAVCIVAAPIYSLVLLGRIDAQLVLFSTLLAAGYGINLFAVPMHFAGMARGIMRWNIGAQIAAAVAISGVGSAVGWAIGGTGVVIGQLVGLILGTGLVLLGTVAICACAALGLWWR
ncbi:MULTISPECIES: oligosaccharide flippase family protein [unclassified Aurantimonas]|uniref:oligosaccharide flippase family protein n=1 Tax=unclassified Aurantimonas TaxID=2638230 RepID=UPI002E17610B|nr:MULTISPECIES: oligosaccharide flippase family protein [unclassified Aurantimonas]MEC5292977.1 oligosaccharide flippase family protein [Aurantimonas sp. C2-3-R2]MEC5414162.1 oligosaccharide flippase family protein [Aurantimonas sp. C2-4-R8]